MNAALLQAFGGLILIIGLMFLAAWVFRRGGGLQALGRGPVRVVGGVSVGARERVLLLEVADTWLVVGVAPGQVSALHSMPRQDAVVSAGSAPAPGFPAWLARFSRGATNDGR